MKRRGFLTGLLGAPIAAAAAVEAFKEPRSVIDTFPSKPGLNAKKVDGPIQIFEDRALWVTASAPTGHGDFLGYEDGSDYLDDEDYS